MVRSMRPTRACSGRLRLAALGSPPLKRRPLARPLHNKVKTVQVSNSPFQQSYQSNKRRIFSMSDNCCSTTSAGSEVCELPSATIQRKSHSEVFCPECKQKGKVVQGQTVKALLSVSLRSIQDTDYYFCRTQSCPVVYYSADGKSVFTTSQLRERVYQKEPSADDVFVCYCFKHTVSEIRNASPEARVAMVNDINAGIQANQCACDLRNPQGSCCLGNVRGLMKQTEQASVQS